MIYTSYLSMSSKISEDSIKICIMQYPPKWLDKNDFIFMKGLAPSKDTFNHYKQTNDFDAFIINYYNQFKDYNNFSRLDLESLRHLYLTTKKDIYLMCCEKDFTQCHRLYLSYIISKSFHCEIKEFEI